MDQGEIMNKKKVWLFSGIIGILLLSMGISFALWFQVFEQQDTNVVQSACFKVEFTEGNGISLSNEFPVSDSEGLLKTPYTFSIKNICDDSASYQINLESLIPEGTRLPDQYLKVNLQENNISRVTTKLDKEVNVEMETAVTISGATDAYKLYTGILNPNETIEFSLRLWMDHTVTQHDENSMNANFSAKINVITGYYQDRRGTMMAVVYNQPVAYFSYREDITKVIIEDVMEPKETELFWDVSENQDGSVMSYLIPNDDSTTYTLYLQSDGGIKANPKSSHLFYRFSKLETIEGLEHLDTSNVTRMNAMFYECYNLQELDLKTFDTSKVIDMSLLFADCQKLTKLEVGYLDTSNVTSMKSMFYGCRVLTSLDLSHFDTSKVTDMLGMFSYCSKLKSLDLSHFDTSNVTSMESMFYSCVELVSLTFGDSFFTNNVLNMSKMFYSCSSITDLNLSGFDTSKVTTMGGMFVYCISLEKLDLSSFNTQNVSSYNSYHLDSNYGMFYGCSKLSNIIYGDNFVYKEGAHVDSMFDRCPANHPSHESWNGVSF